jgi:primosomal protein N' (replication factor Y)
VQTADPDNVAIRAAAAHDYAGFARAELELRALAKLPPVSRMARLVFREREHDRATARAAAAAAALRDASIDQLSIRGPATAAIARINERFRVELVLIAPTATPIQHALATLRNRDLVTADASCIIDVDPVALL